MKNLGLTVIITLLFIWPLFVNMYTLKYLTDIKRNDHCAEINSPYLVWFFDYYLLGFVVLILLLAMVVYGINHKKAPFLSLKNLFSNMIKDLPKGKMREGIVSKTITLLIIGVSLFYVKLLYDIGQEEMCKDIDPTMRRNLFYYNLAGVIYSGFIFLKNLKN